MASHGAAISGDISYCKNYVKNLAVISLVAWIRFSVIPMKQIENEDVDWV